MSLPRQDIAYLDGLGDEYEIATESGMTCVVIRNWALPQGFDHGTTDLLLRLNAGYPDIRPDMWWFCPAVQSADGRDLPATDVAETYLGRSWQRWSRHLADGQWQSGVDGLESYLALIREDLGRGVVAVAT